MADNKTIENIISTLRHIEGEIQTLKEQHPDVITGEVYLDKTSGGNSDTGRFKTFNLRIELVYHEGEAK